MVVMVLCFIHELMITLFPSILNIQKSAKWFDLMWSLGPGHLMHYELKHCIYSEVPRFSDGIHDLLLKFISSLIVSKPFLMNYLWLSSVHVPPHTPHVSFTGVRRDANTHDAAVINVGMWRTVKNLSALCLRLIGGLEERRGRSVCVCVCVILHHRNVKDGSLWRWTSRETE